MSELGTDNQPFFILGCVRSGTTMLRDLLRLHPRLECPEETHFYRWADPYGSPRYDRTYITLPLFKNHRAIDGIAEQQFHTMRQQANSKAEIMQAYGDAYLQAQGNNQGRWFDKTPQNVYGVFLLANDFPGSKIIHIHRNPLNVVASLKEGKVMAKHKLNGAINYWLEALTLVSEFKKIYPQRLLEIGYENLVAAPAQGLEMIGQFLNEDASLINQQEVHLHPEKNNYRHVLSEAEQQVVRQRCQSFMELYGYAE